MEYDKFHGVNLQETPHLIRAGELSGMRNLRADTQELVKRPGIELLRMFEFANAPLYLPTVIFDLPIPYRPGTDARSVIGHQSVDWGMMCSAYSPDPDSEDDIPDFAFDNWPDLGRPEPLGADTIVINVSTAVIETDQYTLFALTLTAIQGGVAYPDFTDGAGVQLLSTFCDLTDINQVEHLVLTPTDTTTGWINGVWQQDVVISSINEYNRLWIAAVYDKNYGTTVRLKVTQ